MRQDIYIVTEGDYSSYEIIACFRTLESAQQYCRTIRLNRLRADIEYATRDALTFRDWLDWLDGKGDMPRRKPESLSRNIDTIIGGHNPIVDMEWDNVNGGWIRMGPEKQIEMAKIRLHSECITRLSKIEDELRELSAQLVELPERDFRQGGEYGEQLIETHHLWDDPVPALEAKSDS